MCSCLFIIGNVSPFVGKRKKRRQRRIVFMLYYIKRMQKYKDHVRETVWNTFGRVRFSIQACQLINIYCLGCIVGLVVLLVYYLGWVDRSGSLSGGAFNQLRLATCERLKSQNKISTELQANWQSWWSCRQLPLHIKSCYEAALGFFGSCCALSSEVLELL